MTAHPVEVLSTPPEGTRYDERRQWLLPQGVVARQLTRHPLFPRPKKNASGKSFAVSFDELAGNTALGCHMSRLQPGAHNRGHRHLDEAMIFIVAGRGWSELRQSDDVEVQRVEWTAGDLVAIPANAWHQHFNADLEHPARQLAFKNTQLLRGLFGSREFVYDNDFRFSDRYADEPDYWQRRRLDDDGAVMVNALRQAVSEPLHDDPSAGPSVMSQRYRMGGHRLLEVTVYEVPPGGQLLRARPPSEELIVVLSGRGVTVLQGDGGREATVSWSSGDLLAPPAGVVREHRPEGDQPVRLLVVRDRLLQRSGQRAEGDDAAAPDRFPTVLEPDYPQEPANAPGGLNEE